jgi:hypothetical protein
MSSFFTLVSTSQKFVSTYVVENLTSPNSISITSPFIVSNLSTPGFVLIDQTLYVRDNVVLEGSLNVKHAVRIFGSTFADDLAPFTGNTIQVLSSVGIGGSATIESLYVKSTLTLFSTVQVSTLQVTQSSVNDVVHVSELTRASGLVSTLGNLAVGKQTTVGRNVFLLQEVSTLGGNLSTFSLSIDGSLYVQGGLSTVANSNTLASFLSSLEEKSSLVVKKVATFISTLDLSGSFYTSSFYGFNFSTLGSVSTTGLNLLSTASIKGNISTSLFESYQYISIGGNLVTPASISSIFNTNFQSNLYAKGTVTFATAHTSSSVGVGETTNVLYSTIASYAVVGNDFQTKNLTVDGQTQIKGSVGVSSNAFVYGNLTVLGEPTISSYLVESFLLNDLQIMTSSPFTSFAVSSLNASTLHTEFTRISRAHPDIFAVSSSYASTTQLTNAITEMARFDTGYSESVFLGDTSSLASNSFPRAGINLRTNFAQGLSTMEVRVDNLLGEGVIVGNPVGTVGYLSNIPYRFPFLSAITTTASTVSVRNFFTSSFTGSSFVIPKFINIQSTVVAPYVVFESQGFEPRYDTNQFLTLNRDSMVVNRSLFFNNQTKKVGLFVSSPLYDFDISGQVFASNLFFSSINTLIISTSGTFVYSTIQVSSSYIQNNLSYGEQGLRLFTRNPFTENGYFEINTLVSTASNVFGLYDCIEQSTILLNNAVQINRQHKVGINQVNEVTGALVLPVHALSVNDTVRVQELYTSSLNLMQSLQTTSLITPNYSINCNVEYPVNTLSTSFAKLILNSFVTLKTDPIQSNRFVGIQTMDPQASLDIRGDAYFSSLYTFENTRLNYVAISAGEF